ncbi:Anaerobic glycerol-3-phosphate dehydrogenase subunit C [Sporomusa silvacetica DSM 10669]|uniref:Anaerobic glycerol-3-phosphate dehydrogenase subunit C n=1 Tax=Sporomusa silvacetica DSM 10669 TaxID=1123289 RepID=A0ABZ3IPX0_9FIRM|nr:anaerobic glycerol-3-phosphate dehydrogenase subunit C [Sporomusa silvacetica]OZC16275.1 anaerobic glycerol-3-phosphate dehydrogenase subunit C [Sporomusa silvacetica DSM 10669]
MEKEKLTIDYCLKCSYCNTVCPLLKVCPDYPGPKKLGSDIERFRREGLDCSLDWVDYCLGCGQCDLICPNQVNVSEYIAEAKAQRKKTGVEKIRDYFFARPALLGKMSTIVTPVSNCALKAASPFMPLGGITAKRNLPAYTAKPLLGTDGSSRQKGEKEQILLFPGCFIKYNDSDIGAAAVKVLEKAGYAVEIAQTGCCGLPAASDKEEALADARNNILAMKDAVMKGWKIVTACTSCGHTLKSRYAGLFSEDEQLAKLAQMVAASTYDLGELLVASQDRMEQRQPTVFRKLAYHAPCHLKAQGIGKPWVKLLKSNPCLEIIDVDNGCCGMSGTYGFKKEKYDISMKIGQALFDGINECKPDMVITECATCRLQIQHGTKYKALHPVEVFAQIFCS